MFGGEDEYEYDEKRPIVMDNGAGYIKAGFAQYYDDPPIIIPSIVGYPRYAGSMMNTLKYGYQKEYFVGNEAESKRGVLKIKYPIEHDTIKNYDDMEKIWFHIFVNELRAASEEHNVMLTECSTKRRDNREKIAEIMFEEFGVPGLYIINQTVLSLFSAGLNTGIVVNLGDGVSQFSPIFEGFELKKANIQYDFGGRELTEYFINILQGYGYKIYSSSQREIAKEIKEKGCFFTLDNKYETIEPFNYELPDGNTITIKDPEIRCLKSYFNPKLYDLTKYDFNFYSIGQKCYDSIQSCDIDIRKDLYSHVFLSGGTSMFQGLPELLKKDLITLAPPSIKENVKVIARYDRKYSAWRGGQILSTISTFKDMWVTKTEYEVYGASIIRRTFF